MDLGYRVEKQISEPLCVKLADCMQINQQSRSVPEVAFIGNYSTNLTYDDVVILFREFGYVMSGICYDSRVGRVNHDDEFANYIPHFMEFIIRDIDTISILTEGIHKSIRDQIEMGNNAGICYRTKLRCVNIMFDHLVHNSQPLLNMFKKAITNRGDASEEVYATYTEGFKNIFTHGSNFLDMCAFDFEPSMLIQEINGEQGLLYSNLMNEIFAYATFWIVKSMSVNGSDMIVDKFRVSLMDNGVDNYRELIRNFLKSANVNSFSLYIKNVIKCDIPQDYTTEDASYFAENGTTYEDLYDEDLEDDAITINKIH